MKASAAALLVVVAASSGLFAQPAAAPPQAPPPAEPPPGWRPTPEAISLQQAPFRQHSITLTIVPKEGMEFKYRLARGAAMLYSWTSSDPLFYEMHASPDETPRFAEFFEKSEGGARAHGSYVAPFTGIHGWYWENRSNREVTITLTATGFFTETIEFRSGQPPVVKPLP